MHIAHTCTSYLLHVYEINDSLYTHIEVCSEANCHFHNRPLKFPVPCFNTYLFI